MRRSAVRQRVQEKAKAMAQLRLGQAERLEYALLNVLPVNSNAARAQLVTVQHQVVTFRTHFPRCGFELIQILINDARERMLSADPRLVRVAPFEERETGEPDKFPLCAIDLVQGFTEMKAHLASDQGRGLGTLDLLLRRDCHHQVAGLC